ncbi:hypothetical protein G6F59_017729 [Rhizopus arrhizus]|nr:hypothetical protein G6F59_017729 [Rhizopus arrhizus]
MGTLPRRMHCMSWHPVGLWNWSRGSSSSTDVDDGLGDLVLGGDHLRVGLEVALRGDHVDQLLGEVDGGRFQRTGLDLAEVGGVRHAAHAGC